MRIMCVTCASFGHEFVSDEKILDFKVFFCKCSYELVM